MAISKLILNGVTQMDVTTDTVDAQYMVSGKTATKADGTKTTGSLTSRSSSDLTASGATVTVPAGVYSSQASKSVASGTAGTPTATKGTVSNNSVSVTPSVTNTTGYIAGSTKTGTAVTVTASELVSGTKSITENGTGIDVTNYANVDVSVESGTTYTATVVESNESSGSSYVGARYNSVDYYKLNDTFTFHAGDTVVLHAMGSRAGGSVYVDGTSVAYDGYNQVSYTYTLPAHDINFRISYLSSGTIYVDFPTIAISTNGKHDVTDYVYADVNVSGGGGGSTYSLTNIVPQQTIATTTSNLYGYVGLIPSYTAYVQSGEWYLVTYDNTEYVVTGYYGANSEILVGDYQLITSTVEWLETPFIVEHNLTNDYFFLGTRVSGNHTLKVDKINFIDDGVTLVNKTVTSNGTYNASSDNADGYSSVTVNVSGGGGSGPTLLTTKSIGTISYSSTTSADTGQSITVTGYNDYDVLLVDVSADSPENGGHVSTVSMAYVTGTSDISTKNTFSAGSEMWHCKLGSTGTASTRKSTTGYGIYAQSVTVSDGTMTITLWQRYSSTYTGTINGSYTARVYGLNLYELIGG